MVQNAENKQQALNSVIVITATAIIAATTITTSIGAARPAFAKVNCNEDFSICSGGQITKQDCLPTITTCNGGGGGQ